MSAIDQLGCFVLVAGMLCMGEGYPLILFLNPTEVSSYTSETGPRAVVPPLRMHVLAWFGEKLASRRSHIPLASLLFRE